MKYKVSAVSAIFLFFAFSAQAQEASSVPVDSIEPEQQQTAQPESASPDAGWVESEKFTELSGTVDGLNESYLETKGNVDKLKKIKVSGYVQAQVRYADTMVTSAYKTGDFAGGSMPSNTQSLFQVRRGRFKIAYDNGISMAAIQLDCVPKGVSIKDAYLRFSDPWIKSIALKAGVFDRPFGFEISYSSSSRESPERSRLFQTLFPGERGLGMSLEYDPSENLPAALTYFNFKGGLFTGNGIADENDDNKDAIGRLGVSIPVNSVNLAVDGGVSGYFGKVQSMNDAVYEMSGTTFSATTGKMNTPVDRQYLGGDLQFYFGDIPMLGGICVRGEAITGQQPGRRSSSASPSSNAVDTSSLYMRNFLGYYGMLIQNLDPIRSQLVLKYDVYDPNTDIEGATVASSADMMFSTLGLGLVHHWDANVKFVAYYDLVMNEEIASGTYANDVTDNVFTFRIQYKF